MTLLIVADDITGAADTAAPFALAGHRVALGVPSLHAFNPPPDATVIAVSTETRDTPPYDQTAFVRLLAQIGALVGPVSLYKKVDSTLRGAYAAEISAMLHAHPGQTAILCPAFPAVGRTFVEGRVRVHGKLLAPDVTPVESFEQAIGIGLEVVRSGGLPGVLESLLYQPPSVVMIDAETEADLVEIAQAVQVHSSRVLPCGSGGLARQLAGPHSTNGMPGCPIPHMQALVLLVGSRSQVSRQQARFASEAFNLPIFRTVREVISASDRHQTRCVLVMSPDDEQEPDEVLQKMMAGADYLCAAPGTGVFVTGGAAASALLCQMPEIDYIRVDGEYRVGVPCCSVCFSNGSTMPLLLKSGGFGDPSLLLSLLTEIAARSTK
jgi:D-threonate/D-erythronate kinase